MKILIIGDKGQLGSELKRILATGESEIGKIPKEYDNAIVTGVDLPDFDITSKDSILKSIDKNTPDLVINCAAMTNVDGCEKDPDSALKVNAIGAGYLAEILSERKIPLVHVSTDYVFEGNAVAPYKEWDITNPQGAYGHSKRLGEELVLRYHPKSYVVRTAWLYGYEGGNFVKTILKVAKSGKDLSVVGDQVGNPTHANDLAHHILKIVTKNIYGIYHCTNHGICSWYDFAMEFLRLAKVNVTVKEITSDQYPTPTKRPEYSALDNMMLRNTVGDEMRTWQDAIASYIKHLEE